MMSSSPHHKKQGLKCDIQLCGTVTIGSKGQIVIPKEVRTAFQLVEGDQLMVTTKNGIVIGLIKSDNLSTFLSWMQSELEGS